MRTLQRVGRLLVPSEGELHALEEPELGMTRIAGRTSAARPCPQAAELAVRTRPVASLAIDPHVLAQQREARLLVEGAIAFGPTDDFPPPLRVAGLAGGAEFALVGVLLMALSTALMIDPHVPSEAA